MMVRYLNVTGLGALAGLGYWGYGCRFPLRFQDSCLAVGLGCVGSTSVAEYCGSFYPYLDRWESTFCVIFDSRVFFRRRSGPYQAPVRAFALHARLSHRVQMALIMRIAYLVNQYPIVSHVFIRREILALERRGSRGHASCAKGVGWRTSR